MKFLHDLTVQWVPIDQVRVVNHRDRGRRKCDEIVASVVALGVKMPIVVAERPNKAGEMFYDLVYGEGRLEAIRGQGGTKVPALIADVGHEELLLMSLVENLARRMHTTVDMARTIASMRKRGDKPADIARKVGLSAAYVTGILRLVKHGEERLLVAVERQQIPMSVAITIAECDEKEVQRVLTEAYDKGELRGAGLKAAMKLVSQRRANGSNRGSLKGDGPIKASSLLKVFGRERDKHAVMMKRARLFEARLSFVTSATRKLLADESMVNLLRAEGLNTLPSFLADQKKENGHAA